MTDFYLKEHPGFWDFLVEGAKGEKAGTAANPAPVTDGNLFAGTDSASKEPTK